LIADRESVSLPRIALGDRGSFFAHPSTWLWAVLVLTALAYIPGLNGPFLFDDPPNIIQPIQLWLDGTANWKEIVFGNDSGTLGRSISMLSFLANAASSGLAPLPFKATNLAIHLICGTLVYALMSRLLMRDPRFAIRARWMALIVSAIWLLHPMQVSTVLYVVQRMAQLSAMFMLAAMLIYVYSRLSFEQVRQRSGQVLLFVALPVTTLMAMFSKENGALVPLLCAVIELGYFQVTAQTPRPGAVKLFFVLSLLLPAILVTGWLVLHPQFVTGGYEGRMFTLGERLLSEPRALMEYMGALLAPRGSALGLYTDDFAISHGLFNPPGTLFAILGLIAVSTIAWVSRRRMPALFVGIGLYLSAHVMESGVFPLELYFEHRNYLPSAGFFLAIVAIVSLLINLALKFAPHPDRIRRLIGIGIAAFVMVLGTATLVRASVWSSWHLLAAQGVLQHPNSMRALLDQAVMLQLQGRTNETQQLFDHMATIDNPAARHVALIDTVALQCMTAQAAKPEAVARMQTIAGAKLQLAEMLAFENFGKYLQDHDCKNLSKARFASIIVDTVNAAPQPPKLIQLWRSRFAAARLYLSAGMSAEGVEQTILTWKAGATDNAIGVFLANLYYVNGDVSNSRAVLTDVQKRLALWDDRNRKLTDKLHQQLESASPSPNKTAFRAE